jgi:hypothetical protein
MIERSALIEAVENIGPHGAKMGAKGVSGTGAERAQEQKLKS